MSGVFNNWLQRKNDGFDKTGITDPDTLIIAANMKYINITYECDRQDPRDTKILALTTRLGNMELTKQSPAANSEKNSSDATDEDDAIIEGTTMVKKCRAVKTLGTVNHDNKTWHWCPKDVMDDTFDGLYVTHKPADNIDYKSARGRGQHEKGKDSDVEKDVPK